MTLLFGINRFVADEEWSTGNAHPFVTIIIKLAGSRLRWAMIFWPSINIELFAYDSLKVRFEQAPIMMTSPTFTGFGISEPVFVKTPGPAAITRHRRASSDTEFLEAFSPNPSLSGNFIRSRSTGTAMTRSLSGWIM